jgi:curli production assembly/transport component CsgG
MKKILAFSVLVLLMSGCAITQKTGQLVGVEHEPKLAENKMQKEFDLLPPPAGPKLSVAVYQFADKTGQRKPTPGIASFSTAVTQGADVFLIKALQDVGNGRWFDVVERGNIDALTKERLIIKQMREAYEGKDAKPLMPMQFAGIIMEGGIIGYDSGLESGGIAYKFLGIGPQTQYSKDIVTVSLRAISVNTGKILAAVTVTKIIYSTADSVAILKSIDPGGGILQQVFNGNTGSTSATAGMFEFESGLTINEPATLAVKTTVESAVVEMIKEGERKGVWDYRKPQIIVQPATPQAPVVVEVKKEETISAPTEVKKDEIKSLPVEIKKEEPKVASIKMSTIGNTRVYERKSELKEAPFGPYIVYPKDTEFTVVNTEFDNVVEITDKKSKKWYVRKDMLK